ncbi:MAG TPA: Imm74 family immunity protein [Candidatus Dormibacteraeota bacterium]|nr:Imm74 family immunity protein [Candidatus Dormibacteraeota bacterium]
MRGDFRSPQPRLVEGPGFSVEELGRTGLCYTEGERVMLVDSEGLAVPGGMAVYRDSIKSWQPPHEDDPVRPIDRARIIDNIRSALRFSGYEINVL